MSKNLLDEVLYFEDHKKQYSKSERKAIRKAFKNLLKSKSEKLRFTRSIDELNQF